MRAASGPQDLVEPTLRDVFGFSSFFVLAFFGDDGVITQLITEIKG